MSKISFLDRINLSEFIEGTIDSSIKLSENSKLLEEDGFVSALPWGKLVSFFAKQIIEIKDRDLAFQKAIAFSYFKTFTEALERYNIQLSVDKNYLALFKQSTLASYKVEEFILEDFSDNAIVKSYKKSYATLLTNDAIVERDVIKINNYVNDYLKLNFYSVLENYKLQFKVLTDFTNSPSYQEYTNKFLRERYRNEIKNDFTQRVLNDEKGVTLEDIYVEPEYEVYVNCFKDKDARLNEPSFHRRSSFCRATETAQSIHTLIHNFFNKKISLDLRSNAPNVLLVLGSPGQGKSSLCKKVVYDSLNDAKPIGQEIYFIKLREIKKVRELINDPVPILAEYLSNEIEVKISDKQLRRSILILDGLDELYMKDGLSMTEIDSFCKELTRTGIDNPDMKIIITSRYGYVELIKINKENLLIVQLTVFDIEKQIQWLNAFRVFHPDIVLTADKLLEIADNKGLTHISELIEQPILLHMVATSNIDIDVDANRAYIYDKLFETLIDRNWDKGGQIANLEGIEKEELRDLIREIALSIFHKGKGYINRSELLNLESVKSISEHLNVKNVADALKVTMIAFYFQDVKKATDDTDEVDSHNDYAIEFLHKSLQEYMTAEKMWTVFSSFTEKRNNKKYLINTWQEALKTISGVFSIRLLTEEVRGYLGEIINNDITCDKAQLANRLSYFLRDLVNKDFLYEYSLDNDYSALDLSINSFYGYWNVLSNLKVKRNFILEDFKQKLVYLIHCLSSKEASLTINLSYQDLNDVNLTGIRFVSIDLDNADLRGADMSFSLFHWINLDNALLEGASFRKCGSFTHMFQYFTKRENHTITLKDTDLSELRWYTADLSKREIESIDFSFSVMENVSFAGSNLKDSTFENTYLNNINFKDTVLDNVIFEETIFIQPQNLTYEQLSRVATLHGSRGIEDQLLNKLKESHPNLFEEPRTDYILTE